MRINENMQERLRGMLAPEGAGSGSGAGSEEPPVPVDVSTLPVAQIDQLLKTPEAEVKKILNGEVAIPSAKKPEEDDKGAPQETPEQKIDREKAEAATAAARAAETPEQKAAREKEEGKGKSGEEKLFAGKYKTKEDLVTGFVNAAKALNYNPKLLEKMAALALKTGDVETIEEVYKDLELAIASNNKAGAPGAQHLPAGPKPGTSDKPERDTLAVPTKMDEAMQLEATRLTLQGALSELRGSRIVARMERQGVNLPDTFMVDEKATKEFLATLEKELPWMYDQLENELTGLVNKHSKEVSETIRAIKEAEVENPKRRESEVAKIKTEAQAIQLPVKDDELTAFVEDALKQPWVYEVRNGIQFIREGAIMDAWLIKNHAAIKKQIQINGELSGRTQAVDDINTHRKKGSSSISDARIPADQGARREKAGTLDLTDPTVLESLSKEEIDALLKDPTKREALAPK